MNELSRTTMFVVAAAVASAMGAGAWYSGLTSKNTEVTFGEDLFPEFDDSLAVTELRVSSYDMAKDAIRTFSVKRNADGLWTIPSHKDYPAEAESRLARTSASLLGLKRVAIQSRNESDWAKYGVLDPENPSAGKSAAADDPDADEDQTNEQKKAREKQLKEERFGTRVVLLDSAGNSMLDLIVGNEVEGQAGHFYVRAAEENVTYITKLQVDLSAKFSDWIEPDLLKTRQSDLTQILVRNYSVDEQTGYLNMGDELSFQLDKEQTPAKWTMAGLDEATEKLDDNGVRDMAREVAGLKIVDVRRKPEGINADLSIDREIVQDPLTLQILQQDMQRQGFFVAQGPDGGRILVSNEGEFQAGSSEGLRYTLYFGEIAREADKDINVRFGEQSATDGGNADQDAADNAAEPGVDEETGPRRYLLVKVEFDETLLGEKPVEPQAPEKPSAAGETKDSAQPADSAPTDAAAADKADAAPQTDDAKKAEPAPVEPEKTEPEGTEPEKTESAKGDTAGEEPATEPNECF
ncbi:MAG: DUF4340 domain-containing protein, partial [Planctomycetaceae bacterium]|nr:DUF4340 domain-containing protein [Planctomycetaceae bacterium]